MLAPKPPVPIPMTTKDNEKVTIAGMGFSITPGTEDIVMRMCPIIDMAIDHLIVL
jgi:hypothetical protein